MASKLLVIEERVPGPDHAVRLHVPNGGNGDGSTRLPHRSGFIAGLSDAIAALDRRPCLLLGPNRRVARQWIDTIARTGMPVFNVHVSTPRALCYDLAVDGLVASGLSVASHQVGVNLVEKVLREAIADKRLKYFPAPRSLRRFAERMASTLTAMRMADLDAKKVLATKPFGNTPKARDLAYLLDAYIAQLDSEKLADATTIARMARKAVETGNACLIWDAILIPAGLQLIPLEASVLASLGSRVTEVPIDPSPHSFDDPETSPVLHFSRAVGEANEIRGVLRRCIQEGIRLDEVELLHTDESVYPPLVQDILAVMPENDAHDLPVTFAEGLPIRGAKPSRALLAWIAWRSAKFPQWQLARMLRDGLIQWWEFVPKAEPAAAAQANEAQDPPKVDAGPDAEPRPVIVTRAGLVRQLRRLTLELNKDRSAATIRAAITSLGSAPLATFMGHGQNDEDEPEFDESVAQRIKDDRIRTLTVLAAIVDDIFLCEPPRDAKAIDILNGARRFITEVAASTSEFDNNAQNRLVAELDERARWLDKHPETPPHDIIEWLRGLVDTLVVMGSAPRPGCIHVASITSGGHSGRPVTFIVGLDESRFPRVQATDPVLPDHDRVQVSDALETSSQTVARSRTDFWNLLGRLRGDVWLSYTCRDLVEQSEVFPSPLLLEAYGRHLSRPAIPLETFIRDIGRHTDAFVSRNPATALTQSDKWLSQLGVNPVLETVHKAIKLSSTALSYGIQAMEAVRSGDFTAWDGNVPDAGSQLDPSHPDGRPASAHSLETLGACPRRFFFRYGLDVHALDTREPDASGWLDPLERGSVMHTVLERFMRLFLPDAEHPPAGDPHPVFARDTQTVVRILDDVLVETRAAKPTADDAEYDRQQRELSQALGSFLKAEERHCRDTGTRPLALEAAIGMAPKERPTKLDQEQPFDLPLSEERTVRLRGYVDRVDDHSGQKLPREYSIIDYKSGGSTRYRTEKAGDPLAVFHNGRRLQHGLYVLMVRHVVRSNIDKSSEVATFTYLFPSAKGSGERLQWTPHALSRVVEIVDNLCSIVSAGAFLATNDDEDCKYCDYAEVCGDPIKTVADANRNLAIPKIAGLFAGLRTAEPAATPSPPIPPAAAPPFAPAAEPELPAQADAADRNTIRKDLATSFAVNASAGTGKTASLVDRMVALIRTGTATVREIAAITFTKKAAAELARRFRQRLEEVAAATVDNDERDVLRAAIADIDSVVIGTVHAFCGMLLRERPIEAGLDPSVEMLDAAAESMLMHRAWREFREVTMHDKTLGGLRRTLESSGVEFRDLWPAFRTLVTHADVQNWPTDDVPPPVVSQLVDDVCKEIAAKLPEDRPPWPERGSDKLMNILEAALRDYNNRPNNDTSTLMKVADVFCSTFKAPVQEVWWPSADKSQRKANAAVLKKWWEKVQSDFSGPLRQWHAYRYRQAIPLLTEARDYYDRLRESCGLLSFSDLLVCTAKLLRERPDVRVVLADRFRFLLVDEFQDTDPIQAEIMLLLTADAPGATDWRTTKVKPGSLFVVGDPQQSIYRFRRADIEVFEFVKDRIVASGGRVLHLTTNFRTNSDLTTWVSSQFASQFDALRTANAACSPEFASSTPGRSVGSPGVLAGRRQIRIEGTDVRAEAEAIATFIRRAINNCLTVSRTESEKKLGIPPECRPEDFLIVAGDTDKLSAYAAALSAVGLPCEVTGRKGPDSKYDLRILKLCLQVVADRDDAIATLAVLRSPVFGFSDADLYAFRSAGGMIRGWLQVPAALDPALRERFEDAAQAMREWRDIESSLPVPAAIEAIADKAGLLLIASVANGEAGRSGRAAAGTLMTFLERVRSERQLLNCVQDVIDHIDALVANTFPKQDFDTIGLDALHGGAVRVMNLHKVKGLEAPVVFLCDTGGSGKIHDPSWHVARTPAAPAPLGFLTVRRALNTFGNAFLDLAEPLDWATHEGWELTHLQAEDLRKKYVAVTRPGCCLITSVFTTTKGVANKGWYDLAPDVTTFDELPALPAAPMPADETGSWDDDAAMVAKMTAANDAARAIRLPTYDTVTPRDFLTKPTKQLRHSGDGLGEAWGTVIHLMLERVLRNQQQPRPDFDLAALAASALAESELAQSGSDMAKLADRAVHLVEEVRQSQLWKRINAGGEFFIEVPFTICVDAAEVGLEVQVDKHPRSASSQADAPAPADKLPVLIRGQIDLAFRDASATPVENMTDWSIIDWKTSAVMDADEQSLVESYGPQLTLYARCWALRSA